MDGCMHGSGICCGNGNRNNNNNNQLHENNNLGSGLLGT